jgi:hypothetical protein
MRLARLFQARENPPSKTTKQQSSPTTILLIVHLATTDSPGAVGLPTQLSKADRVQQLGIKSSSTIEKKYR